MGSKRIRWDLALFLQEAKRVHGGFYNYDRVVFSRIKGRVTIGCPVHGYFDQVAYDHIKGRKCRRCASGEAQRGKRKTAEQWIAEAREVHGDRYVYSDSVYRGANHPVEVSCPDHGVFTVRRAVDHLRGTGCRACGYEVVRRARTSSRGAFIEKGQRVHGERFDYSDVEYNGVWTPVEIICPAHGPFSQTPQAHLKGRGCVRCANDKNRLSTEAWVQNAVAVHGDTYDYSMADYVRADLALQIICQKHGAFWQTPADHVSAAAGCPKCGYAASGQYRADAASARFLEAARRPHGDRYDYSRVDYVRSDEPVEIVCSEHGPFWQTPVAHIHQGSGCPTCAPHGFNDNAPATLYWLRLRWDGYLGWKIGITNRSPAERYASQLRQGVEMTVELEIWFERGGDARAAEREVLDEFEWALFPKGTPSPFKKTGVGEIFTEDVFSLSKSHRAGSN